MSLVYEKMLNDYQSNIKIKYKGMYSKTYKQVWHTKYRWFYFISQKVFKCLVIINPWFAVLGGYRLVSGAIGVKIGRPIINQS